MVRRSTDKKLKIYPANGTLARPFALMDRKTAGPAEKLAAAFGRLTGDKALVMVPQNEQVEISTLLQAQSRGPAPDETLSRTMDELSRQF